MKHRGHGEKHGLLVTRIDERFPDALGRKPRNVVKRSPDTKAAQKTQDQTVRMNQRQRMNDRVALGPLPSFGKRVEIRRDVSPR
jgi:hypothetical protein